MKRSGLFSMRHFDDANDGYMVTQSVSSVVPGASYLASGYVNVPSTSDTFSIRLDVRWVSDGGANLGTSTVRAWSSPTRGWSLGSRVVTAPANARRAVVRQVVSSLNAVIYVDDVSFRLANVLRNGGFELDANGDTRPDSRTANSHATRSTARKFSGASSMRHRATDGSSHGVDQTTTWVVPGGRYAFSARTNIPSTADSFSFAYRVLWRSATGALLRTDSVGSRTSHTSGAWRTASATLTAPAQATQATVRMAVGRLNSTIYADDVVLRR